MSLALTLSQEYAQLTCFIIISIIIIIIIIISSSSSSSIISMISVIITSISIFIIITASGLQNLSTTRVGTHADFGLDRLADRAVCVWNSDLWPTLVRTKSPRILSRRSRNILARAIVGRSALDAPERARVSLGVWQACFHFVFPSCSNGAHEH